MTTELDDDTAPHLTVFIGTRAQLIKMAPVMLELELRQVGYRLILTGQHEATMQALLADFGVATQPELLYRGPEITGIAQMGWWFIRCLVRSLVRRRALFPAKRESRHRFLVHGDTFSTLLGALVGKLIGAEVVHIESGLRSFNPLHPFPEELTRLAVFRLTDIACCPGEWASANLAGRRLERLDTGHNTLLDAVHHALATSDSLTDGTGHDCSPEYAVVSIHRFENVFNRKRLEQIIGLLEIAAERTPLRFVLHPSTAKQLERFALMERLGSNPRIQLEPRMLYAPFVRLMASAAFVITDGGSNQEELSYLGIPTLLMRKATERSEGMSSTAVLCSYDRATLSAFVDAPQAYRQPRLTTGAGDAGRSPSQIIVDRMLSR